MTKVWQFYAYGVEHINETLGKLGLDSRDIISVLPSPIGYIYPYSVLYHKEVTDEDSSSS